MQQQPMQQVRVWTWLVSEYMLSHQIVNLAEPNGGPKHDAERRAASERSILWRRRQRPESRRRVSDVQTLEKLAVF